MAYIVESSLDIGGKIIPWSNREQEKLIKEKEELLQKKEEEVEKVETEDKKEDILEPLKEDKYSNKKNKKR